MGLEPIPLGAIARFGSGTITEIEFTENVPAGSSIVGVFAFSGENLGAMLFSMNPKSTPWEYWEETLGSESQPDADVIIIGGNDQLPDTQPVYDPNIYPDPDWNGFGWEEGSDTPYWIQVTDEAENFYGWDGNTVSDVYEIRL